MGQNNSEIWKYIRNYENIYKISNLGKVLSVKRNNLMKPSDNTRGYLYVCLSKNTNKKYKSIHRLVAENFIPNPNNYLEVNHKDGNKLNNNVDNLEWVHRSYNIKHAYSNNLKSPKGAVGIKNRACKLTEKQVLEIRDLLKTKTFTQKEISAKYNVDRSQISCIALNKTWRHI